MMLEAFPTTNTFLPGFLNKNIIGFFKKSISFFLIITPFFYSFTFGEPNNNLEIVTILISPKPGDPWQPRVIVNARLEIREGVKADKIRASPSSIVYVRLVVEEHHSLSYHLVHQ